MTTLRIKPSALQRIQHCQGSATLEALYPAEQSDDARDGEAAHWAFAEQLYGRVVAEGQITPGNVVLTAEMLEASDVALDYVRAKTKGMMGSLMIEQEFFPKRIHPDMRGRLDCGAWLFPASRRPHLFVAEFKFGHRYVDHFENAQNIAAACALLDATKYDDQNVDVTLAIIQPRCYSGGGPVREWNCTASDLRAHINWLHMAVEKALGPNPQCRPNPECGDCRGRHACRPYQLDGFRSMEYSSSAVPFDLTPDAAGLELKWLKQCADRVKGRITGLEAQIEAQLKDGQRVQWWRLENTVGREVWRDEAQALAMGETMGVPLARPVEPITPAQARKAGVPADVVAGFAHRPAGGVKMVPDEGATALARVFGMAK
jgi:hypothetical protein